MALIKCPECGKEVSDKAPACIHCGFPLQSSNIKCPECGKEISDNEQVCIYCGFPLQSNNTINDASKDVDGIIQYLYDRADYFMSNLDEYSRSTSNFLREISPKIKELVEEAKKQECVGDCSVWHKVVIALTKINQQTAYYSGWCEHKTIYSYIDFSKITEQSQKEILNLVFKTFENKTFGGTNHITYWYPIYQLLVYGTEDVKNRLNGYLSGRNITNTGNRYGDVMKMVDENLGAPNLLPLFVQSEPVRTENVPKCPTCQSTDIKKVSVTSKAGSVALWGLFSQKVKKTWHCNNCGYEW